MCCIWLFRVGMYRWWRFCLGMGFILICRVLSFRVVMVLLLCFCGEVRFSWLFVEIGGLCGVFVLFCVFCGDGMILCGVLLWFI